MDWTPCVLSLDPFYNSSADLVRVDPNGCLNVESHESRTMDAAW
jgi:hypothetical protein